MTQKTILITGCSSGIGLAAAKTLNERGWRVFATARKDDDLQRLQDEIGVEALYLELRDGQSIKKCAGEALSRTNGRLDALFNNAAYGQLGAIEDLSAAVLRDQFEVNLIGTHDLTCRIIPAMRAAGHGRIVQCSSVLGLVSGPWRGAYCASKFALEALSDSLRMELNGSGIHVSLIEPGPIWSRFIDNAIASFANVDKDASPHRETYEARIAALQDGGASRFKLPPEAVARRLIHALESPRPKIRYFVTTPTYVAALFKRVLPDRALDAIASRQ